LKALVQDKNVRIDELRRQLELARADFDAKQQAAHDDQERRNKRLYQDNHAYIGQLKDALDKIQHLEAQVEQLREGKQLAETRCGEALEEIATLQKVNHSLVCDVEAFEKGHQRQTSQWKADLLAKDKKMALLRDAIIKLKEEFLKAQEQQAEDSVREKRKQTKKVDGLTCEIQDVNQKYKRAMALVAKSKAALNSRDQSLKAAELRDQLDRCKAKLGT
ncbi:hypothetical protein DYB34_008372, partial [Aphanomyces astaci]